MKEGPVTQYKWHQIISASDTKKHHVYDVVNNEVFVADSIVNAKIWILKKFSEWDISNLEHAGVQLLTYDFNDKIYIVSVTDDAIKKYPQLNEFDYESFGRWGNARQLIKYFHNERGPANYCVDTKEGHYYWKGTLMPKEDWKKCLHEKGFNETWNELMKE